MKRTNKKGFTIVELVIVIAVIAILAAVLIPNISRLVKKANESSDIQAVRNMNTFLAAEGATGDVNSILDVYDIFADSGYNVDSYSPLYSGRHFYYDKQYNQILYVETKSGKVLFPEERKNDTVTSLKNDNHDLFSLSMEAPKGVQPADFSGATTETLSASVSTPEEYAFMIAEYNKGKSKNLTLTLKSNIDMMGTRCLIEKANGTITIKSDNNQTYTIKNVTSNAELDSEIVHNAQGTEANYYAGGIIAKVESGSKIEIANVVFENINVKVPTAGGVGIIIGQLYGSEASMENVTVKNCSVIGHRDVGALIGSVQNAKDAVTLKGKITLENVKVKTTGGRSGLLVGKMVGGNSRISAENATISTKESSLSIYEDSALEQKFATGNALPSDWTVASSFLIDGQDQIIYSFKGKNTSGGKDYSAYAFVKDALVVIQNSNGNKNVAIKSIEDFKKASVK